MLKEKSLQAWFSMLKKPKDQKVHANKISLIPEAVKLVYTCCVALLSLTEFW